MRFTLWTVSVLLTLQVAAQQEINGRVVDQKSGEAVEDAYVAAFSGEKLVGGASTDKRGYFNLELREGKAVSLSVSHVAYETYRMQLNPDSLQNMRIEMVPIVQVTDEAVVKSTRVDKDRPGTQTTISKKELERSNLGQDMPYLLNLVPGAVVNSDAGAGIGYTGIRIRGVDPTRINVTINGIPVNDAESQGVFWVNMPDFASSTQNIQVQRGAGTSTNGAAAFGATINLQTNSVRKDPYAELNYGIGVLKNNWSTPNWNGWNLNTRKQNIQFGTGLLNNGWSFEGRLSSIRSDGFIDRSRSDLKSWFMSGAHYGKRSVFKVNVFAGHEVTYQAWNGIPEPKVFGNEAELKEYYFMDDSARLAESGDRTYNAYTYEREVDDYRQEHIHLHYSYRITSALTGNISLHQTLGKGFYEQYRYGEDLADYGLDPVVTGSDTTTQTDLIRRRWLDNWFRGVVYSLNYQGDRLQASLGGAWNTYHGKHFGEIIWARFASNSEIRDHYYDDNAIKADFNLYGKVSYEITPSLSAYLDMQYRQVDYSFLGFDASGNPADQVVHYHFVNPKAGAQYYLNTNSRLFLTYSRANREPVRNDFVSSTPNTRPKPETLDDFELGYETGNRKQRLQVVAYAMLYTDQLILTGQVNDVGAYTRTNVDKSSRLGLEVEYSWNLLSWLQWNATLALSRNKTVEFTEYVDEYDASFNYLGQKSITYKNSDLAFSPAVVASSMFRFKLPMGVDLDWIAKYVSRQYLDNSQSEERSLRPFFVNDLRLTLVKKKLLMSRELRFSVQANNVLNTAYEPNGYTFGWYMGSQRFNYNYLFPQAGTNFLAQLTLAF